MSKVQQVIKFEYCQHKCIIYKDGKHWDAEISPPNGLACSWTLSPFRSRFIGRTLNKVIKMVDHQIEFEDEMDKRHIAMYGTPGPPKIHS